MPQHPSPLTLDPEKYADLLKAFDFDEKQKQELLESLFNIVVSFVDQPVDKARNRSLSVRFKATSCVTIEGRA